MTSVSLGPLRRTSWTFSAVSRRRQTTQASRPPRAACSASSETPTPRFCSRTGCGPSWYEPVCCGVPKQPRHPPSEKSPWEGCPQLLSIHPRMDATSLAVQWLEFCFHCQRHRFDRELRLRQSPARAAKNKQASKKVSFSGTKQCSCTQEAYPSKFN